jgi:lysophospholipase L1-like esterase
MKKISALYLILVHTFLLFVLAKSDFIQRVENKFWPETAEKKGLSENYSAILVYLKRMDGNVPDASVIFIGDSLIRSLAVSAVAPMAINYGIAGDTSYGVLQRIGEYQSINRAGIIVLSIGTNDLGLGKSKEEILSNFERIIKMIPPEKKVIFNSILPVDEKIRQDVKRNNRIISSVNNKLEGICLKYQNVYFLDNSELLSGPDGNLQAMYHVGDGLHLNTAGYKIWIASLQQQISIIP